jgi:hypothetical protein
VRSAGAIQIASSAASRQPFQPALQLSYPLSDSFNLRASSSPCFVAYACAAAFIAHHHLYRTAYVC